MWRHDPQRTARQDLPVEILDPAVKWTLSLGARLDASDFAVHDLDRDGTLDVALLRGGRVVGRQLTGALIWASDPIDVAWMLWVGDFDGNGRNEVFAGSHFAGLFVVDGTTGTVLWHPPATSDQRLGDVFPIDANGDGRQELYVADNGCSMSGLGTGRVYSFAAGTWDSAVAVPLDRSAHDYWCGLHQCAGDLDGDGLPEIVTLSDRGVFVYSPRTGTPLYSASFTTRVPYGIGTAFCSDIDGDARSEVIIATDNPPSPGSPGRRLALAELEGSSLRVRWDMLLATDVRSHRFPSPLAAQLVGGGVPEIATSYFDAADRHWHIIVIAGDSASGLPIWQGIGEALLALADLDGDATAEMLVAVATEPGLPSFGVIRALRLDATAPGGIRELWRADRAQLPVESHQWAHAALPIRVSTGATEPDGVLLLRDTSLDGRADDVAVAAPGAGVVHTRAARPGTMPVGCRGGPTLGEPPIVVSYTDGELAALNSDLTLTNDFVSPFGVGDIVETNLLPRAGTVAVVTDDGEPFVLTVDAFQALAVWDASDASRTTPPALHRRYDDLVDSPPTTASVPAFPDGYATVSLVRATDGGLLLAAIRPSSGLELLRARLSETPTETPYWYTDVVALAHPTSTRLVVGLYDAASGSVRYPLVPLDGTTPGSLALGRSVLGGGDFPGSAWDWDRDGTDDYYVFQSGNGRIASGATGELLQSHPSAFVGIASFVDLDGDAVVDLLHDGAANSGPRRLSMSFDPIWIAAATRGHVQGAAARTAGGVVRVGSALQGLAQFELYDGATGELLQTQVLADGASYPDEASARAAGATVGAPTNIVAAAGVPGEPDLFLLGSTDGYLYSLSAETGLLQWTLNLRAAVGEPLIADADGDGVSEILAPAADGNLYAIGSAALDAPAAVFDTDGSFIALGPADDLDEVHRSDRVAANWPAVPGAVGYEAAVVSHDDVVIIPWTDMAGSLRFVREGLVLQLGQRYHTLVRARGGVDGTSVSPETSSDGFVVVDRAPPAVVLSAEPPVLQLGTTSDEHVVIAFSAEDLVALQQVSVEVRDSRGLPVRALDSRAVGGRTFAADYAWVGDYDDGDLVPTGDYLVVGTATDQAGQSAEAAATVVVCHTDEDGGSSCPDARTDADDAGASEPDDGTLADASADAPQDADPGSAELAWSGSGGACTCSAPDPVPGGHPALHVLACLLLSAVFVWRRSAR